MAKKLAVNELESEVEKEVAEVKEEVPQSKGGFVVVAPFELERNFQKKQYEVGDKFVPFEDWARDKDFEEFSKIDAKNDNNLNRVVFSIPNPILDEKGKLKYMDSKRVILPLKEA